VSCKSRGNVVSNSPRSSSSRQCGCLSKTNAAQRRSLDLGIERGQLYKWQRALRAKGTEAAFRGPGAVPLSERSEVECLKRELEQVKEERDILKKAAAYFAKHQS
jgi:transposase-like protein